MKNLLIDASEKKGGLPPEALAKGGEVV